MLVCLYEDRPYQTAGLKLLLLSLNRHCPSWPVRLHFPNPDDSLRKWLLQFKQLTLLEEPLPASGSYNVKPSVLLDGLATGADQCLWIDTDVLVNRTLQFLSAESLETVIVTQDPWEYADGSTYRCDDWGLSRGRSLPGPLNTAVVRVTSHHVSFLEAWESLLSNPTYLAEQKQPTHLRNALKLGDQDAISALLASDRFAHLPVRRLLHASEILQHHGAGAYGIKQRFENLRHGLPALIHAMGSTKPWKMPERPGLLKSPRDYYERLYLELSPYLHIARLYRAQLLEDTQWLEIRTLAGRLSSAATLNHPVLKGALQATLQRTFSRKQ